RQWWMTLTPFAMIIIPSALQYIQWLAWKFPTGCTYTAVGLWLVAWLGRWLQWDVFVNYPLNFVWPATIVPAAIFADWILLKSRSFILTSILGSRLHSRLLGGELHHPGSLSAAGRADGASGHGR